MIQTMTALVVDAEAPLDNRVLIGPHAHGTVRILIEDAEPQIYTAAKFKLDPDHWLVRGMTIPVSIDPDKPEEFTVDWDAIPSMSDRAAANDPTLVDPAGTRSRVDAIVTKATSVIDVTKLPVQLQEMLGDHSTPAATDHVAEALSKASMEPAPRDKVRGVVLISATAVTLQSGGDAASGSSTGHWRTYDGKHDVVLSVHVPGRAPYAVFVHNFKRPARKEDALGHGYPALVSATDPHGVEVLWSEVASPRSQINERLADGMTRMNAAAAQAATDEERMTQQINEASAAASARAAAGMPAVAPHLPDGMREMMAQNAKLALSAVKDPAQRAMLIQQYKLAGIPIDEES